MASSSGAMIPRGVREITITPTWDVSDDVEMTGTTPVAHRFTVPEFVAVAYEHLQAQIRHLAARAENSEELARLSAYEQSELFEAQAALEKLVKDVWTDCRRLAGSFAEYNEQQYQWIESQCGSFATRVEASFAAHTEDREQLRKAIADLTAQQKGLHQLAQSAFTDLGV